MRIISTRKSTKGFHAAWKYMLRFRYMITEQAKQRVRILVFWEKHGDEATTEAFHISRRTLFRWQDALKKARGKKLYKTDGICYLLMKFGELKIGSPNSSFTTE